MPGPAGPEERERAPEEQRGPSGHPGPDGEAVDSKNQESRASRQEPDFRTFTRWADDTFRHLERLFQLEVAKYVTARMLALGSVILTILGVFSFFGLRKGIDLVVEDIRGNAQDEIAAEIRSELANQMTELRELITEGTVKIRVVDQLMERSRQDMAALSDVVRVRMNTLINDVDDQVDVVQTRLSDIEHLSSELAILQAGFELYKDQLTSGQEDIESLIVESRKLVALSIIPLLPVDSLLERLAEAGRELRTSVSDQPDAHLLAVVRAVVETLGSKEFKQREERQKERVVRHIQAIFARQPGSGSVNYNNEAFREIRVQGIYALRALAERSPFPEAGIRALTEMLNDAVSFGERDGAAWALRVLANDDLLAELDEAVITDAVGALARSLTSRDGEEVQRTALQSLRRIATMTGFKRSLVSQVSKDRIAAAIFSADEEKRKAGAEVLRAVVHTRTEEWRELVRPLLEDESQEVRRIGAGILADTSPDELVREAAMQPGLEDELTGEVEEARQAVAADFRARGRRRFSGT